jgi:hypothetical protein
MLGKVGIDWVNDVRDRKAETITDTPDSRIVVVNQGHFLSTGNFEPMGQERLMDGEFQFWSRTE